MRLNEFLPTASLGPLICTRGREVESRNEGDGSNIFFLKVREEPAIGSMLTTKTSRRPWRNWGLYSDELTR